MKVSGIQGKERNLRLPRLTTKNEQSSRAVADKRRWAGALIKSSAALCVMGLFAGCNTKGLLDPTQMVRSGQPSEPLVVPILSKIDPASENGPGDYVTATAPLPSDMVTSTNDYTIGRNDLLNISISDLTAPGVQSIEVKRVSESGRISLPFLGPLQAAGLTEIELEQRINQLYKDQNIIQNSQVSVTVVEALGRTVEVLGSVQQPGVYPIRDADFRLLNALVLAKDTTSPLIEYIYVIRRSESQRPHASSTTRPVTPVRPAGDGLKPPATGPSPDDLTPPKSDLGGGEERKLASGQVRPLSLLADAPAAPAAVVAVPAAVIAAADVTPAATQPFTAFNPPRDPGNVRVIRIPYQAIARGDYSYNIAIHPRDMVVVQPLPVGEYYLGGHVTRPGVYTLSGRRVTLKQAIISGSMYDELAIPQRTDIIRRIKPDREVYVRVNLEQIFAGEQPDVFLKPDDQIMVGTNALAPFLAALRGSFRITYGFGFLYDRNFAYGNNSLGF